jgi:predicted PurR-regulated permease PerM
MGAYVRGQAVVSLSVGALIGVGLGLLGVPYALLLGGVAAALNVVPFLGSSAAAPSWPVCGKSFARSTSSPGSTGRA